MTTTYNLIQVINSLPDELLKSSQAGTNAKWVTHKVNAIRRYMALDEIDTKSKLWKKLTGLELHAPIKTADVPEISGFKYEPWMKDWSGVIEITEAKISVYLKDELHSAGVTFKDITSALDGGQNILEKLLETSLEKFDDRLSALTAGTVNHGFFLSVPEGLKVDKPFKVMVKITDTASFFPLHFLTVLKNHSSVKVVFEFISEGANKESCFIPMIHSSALGASSELELVEIQALGASTFFFPNEVIDIGENAALNRFILDKGSQVTHRAFLADLNQTGGNAQVTGVYFPSGNQRFIYDTQQNHLASDTTSTLLFKGVLDDAGYTLWKGNIFVKEGVRGADGYQLNNTLLLNPATHAESIPGLEISADDVKCSHGLTLSSVDKDQLFYLQTRGIGKDEGKRLIVDGFIRAAISRIKSAELQEYVKENLDKANLVF
ncbi:MAG: SufD family Fe-S cluster assembly protein [Pelolinea sp.]|nr:SufD family Fe-S cluster assembly protein [Pelolinea sp.]